MNFVNLAKNHKAAIFLAIIAAIIIASPQLLFRLDNEDAYRGIEVMGVSNDELSFLTRVREVQDGHFSLSSTYFREGKESPYLFMPLGTDIVALLGRIFFLDLNNTILLSRFVFPFILFLLIYGFVFLLSRSKSSALASSSTVLLASILLSRYGFLKLLSGISPKTDFLMFSRPVNPVMNLFFFFGFLLFFWLFLDGSARLTTRKQWIFGGVSALFLGLSFYDYLYTWTFLYVFCGVLAVIFFLRKRRQDVKRILVVLAIAALIALPYFWNVYQASLQTNPTFSEISQRHGLVEVSGFHLGYLVPVIFIIFLLFYPRKDKDRYFFSLALLVTPFIVLNQQLITGKTLSSAHYHWYYNTPLALIFLLIIFLSVISQKKLEFLKKISAIFIIALSIYTGILIQISSYASHKDHAISNQGYAPALEWLNKNAKKDEVVFTSGELSQLVVIYTPLNVFHHLTIGISFADSKERLLNTIFLLYRLEGIGEDQADEVFFRDRREISAKIYGIYYRDLTGAYENIPDQILLDFSKQYQESLKVSRDEFLKNSWDKYGVKYLIWDKKKDPQWQLDQYQFLKKAAETGDFAIYQPNSTSLRVDGERSRTIKND